jgi:PAS domain S-box-containing protein
MNDTLIKYSQLGDIFDFFSMGVMVLSPERKILSLNQSAEVITGYEASDLVGQNCTDRLMNSLCGGNCSYLEAVENVRKSGSTEIEVTGSPKRTQKVAMESLSPGFLPQITTAAEVEVRLMVSLLKTHTGLFGDRFFKSPNVGWSRSMCPKSLEIF